MIAADWDYMAHGLYNSRPIYDLTEERSALTGRTSSRTSRK
jgi:hypothetical protein